MESFSAPSESMAADKSAMISMSLQKWRRPILLATIGACFGLAYHVYKMEYRVDDFWNVRLFVLLPLGISFFYVLQCVEGHAIRLLSKKYDSKAHEENLKSYIPIILVILYPLLRRLLSFVWPESLYPQFLLVSVATILALKIVVIAKLWRGKTEPSAPHESPGKAVPLLASMTLILPLFLIHQFTLVFDSMYEFPASEISQSTYLSYDHVTRKGFATPIRLSEKVPFDNSIVTLGYRILTCPPEIKTMSGSLPFRFMLRVTDENGSVLASARQVLDAHSQEARKWHDITFELTDAKNTPIHVKANVRPRVFDFDNSFFADLLFHNPIDFPYFRSLSVKAAWSEPEIARRVNERPRVFLISIDTLRPDYLGCYGHEKHLTPAIDSLAGEGLLYANAFTQSTWTLPSYLSLLTSRFPDEVPTRSPLTVGIVIGEPSNVKTLAEELNKAGYYCAGFTEGGFVSAYYGHHRGFQLYVESTPVTGGSFHAAKEWLADNTQKDVFLFLHTYMVQSYYSGYAENGLSPYEFAVKRMDATIADFLSFLKQKDMYDNSLIIFTSDHGEAFVETHEGGSTVDRHGGPPYESLMKVPLIIKPPAGKSHLQHSVYQSDVQLLDVAPTILATLGIRIPADFRGRNIIADAEPAPEESVIYSASFFGSVFGIRWKNMKYIAGIERDELYDLSTDPEEQINLAGSRPSEIAQMKQKYFDLRGSEGAAAITLEEATQVSSPELAEQLKSLGYLK
ncbi:MAG: hypothetical protein Kow0099_16140 [Candidatus Abyssubacteria bacterium]